MSNVPELAAFTHPTFRGELVSNFQVNVDDLSPNRSAFSFRVSRGTYLSNQSQIRGVEPLEIEVAGTPWLWTNENLGPRQSLGLPASAGLYTVPAIFDWSTYALANPSILPSGDLPIATWTLNSAGKITNLQDIRPSYATSIPVTNPGITEVVTGDVTKRATLQNSYYIPSNLDTQPRGRLYVGPGTCLVDGTTTVRWTGNGPTSGFFLGPFVRNGHVCGSGIRAAINDPGNVPDFISGISQIYVDPITGLPTFNDTPFAGGLRLKLSDFLTNIAPVGWPFTALPLAVVLLDSTAGIWKVIDCRPNYITS